MHIYNRYVCIYNRSVCMYIHYKAQTFEKPAKFNKKNYQFSAYVKIISPNPFQNNVDYPEYRLSSFFV